MFNASLVNQPMVNADPLVYAGNGLATVTLEMNGDLTATQSLTGEASISLNAFADMHRGATGIGVADIVANGSGVLSTGLALVGDAGIALSAEGDVAAGYASGGDASLVLQVSGVINTGRSLTSTASIDVLADLESYAVTPIAPQGLGIIEVGAIIKPYHRQAIMPDMDASLWLYASAIGNLEAVGAGSADIAITAQGEARLGDILYGEGVATIEFRANGMSIKWHQVYGSGTADISIYAQAERYGRPAIPDVFTDAAIDCRFFVSPDNTTFYVPKESTL